MLKKLRHVTVFKIVELNFTHIAASVCPSVRQPSSYQRNSKLEIRNNNFTFWLKVWLSRNQFKPVCSSSAHIRQEYLCTETQIAQPPKQRSPRWHMKDQWHTYFFLEKVFFLFEVLFKQWKLFKLEVKSPFLYYTKKYFPFEKFFLHNTIFVGFIWIWTHI